MTVYSSTAETHTVHVEGCRWFRAGGLPWPRWGTRRARACSACLPGGLPEIIRVGPYAGDWMLRADYAAELIHRVQRDQLATLRVTVPGREPAECGECRTYDEFEWDEDTELGAVMRCPAHHSLAPGWVYEGPIL